MFQYEDLTSNINNKKSFHIFNSIAIANKSNNKYPPPKRNDPLFIITHA